MVPLSAGLFPNTPEGTYVHAGFRDAHEKTASVVLATVKKVIADKGAIEVTAGELYSYSQ